MLTDHASRGPHHVSFFVPGRPRTKNKRRAVTIAGKARIIPGKGQEEDVASFQSIAWEHRPAGPVEGPIRLRLRFVFRPAKSWPKWRRESALLGTHRHTKKPDLSRLVTFAEDCLTGLFYVDDSQVVHLLARAVYGEIEGTEVTVETVQDVAGRDGEPRTACFEWAAR